jgi:FkbM family methyltransferase
VRPVVRGPPIFEVGRRLPWLRRLHRAVRVLDNPFGVYLSLAFGGTPTLRFSSGLTYALPRRADPIGRELVDLSYEGAWLTAGPSPEPTAWRVDVGAGVLTTPGGIRFRLESVESIVFAETFLYELHFAGYDLSNSTVVDVGANVGDSALYFASKGARVLAFEPDPANYVQLIRNLELNPRLAPQITTYPEAVGSDGVVRFRSGLRGDSGIRAEGGVALSVPSVSLATLLRRAGLDRAYLLKCDAKGAENELVDQPDLGRFDRLAIEYCATDRGRSLADLERAVRGAGFDRVRIFKHNAFPFYLRDEGMLSAERSAGP